MPVRAIRVIIIDRSVCIAVKSDMVLVYWDSRRKERMSIVRAISLGTWICEVVQ